MEHQKLVRDKIPEIIRNQGETPHTRILDELEYSQCLARKLDEEVAEFHRDWNLEELADILEVVFALAEELGGTREELMDVFQTKHEKRGGFRERVFLISKEA